MEAFTNYYVLAI